MKRRNVLLGLGAVGMVRTIGSRSRLPSGFSSAGSSGDESGKIPEDHIHQLWQKKAELLLTSPWVAADFAFTLVFPPELSVAENMTFLSFVVRNNTSNQPIIATLPSYARPVDTVGIIGGRSGLFGLLFPTTIYIQSNGQVRAKDGAGADMQQGYVICHGQFRRS